MLFRHIIIVYPENQKHRRKLCDPNAEFFSVKPAVHTVTTVIWIFCIMSESNNVSNQNELILPLPHLHDETNRGRYYNSQIPANSVSKRPVNSEIIFPKLQILVFLSGFCVFYCLQWHIQTRYLLKHYRNIAQKSARTKEKMSFYCLCILWVQLNVHNTVSCNNNSMRILQNQHEEIMYLWLEVTGKSSLNSWKKITSEPYFINILYLCTIILQCKVVYSNYT